jgi:ABC-type branched-subunit amino acid transport system permease subunit
MSAQLLFSGVIFGLSLASIYFLISVGLSLCFGLMRIISLDQLLYYSIGAFLTYSVSTLTGSVIVPGDQSCSGERPYGRAGSAHKSWLMWATPQRPTHPDEMAASTLRMPFGKKLSHEHMQRL